ncbi:MAG TPA: M3 family oligoendopeptidase [Anaerolineales bacterium]|nr:M3 family oligoendopeptidase [Anaerolineales bacterium]
MQKLMTLKIDEFMRWDWAQIEPYYQALAAQPIDEASVESWLKDWTRLSKLLRETHQRLWVASTVDTTDLQARQRYTDFLDNIYPQAQAAEQKIKEKLLASGLEPPGFEVPLRNMRLEAELFCEANLPLLSEELKLATEYDKISGAQTVQWQGKEVTLLQLHPVYLDPDRSLRERAWRLASARQLADRQAINDLWVKLLAIRRQLAANANLPDYRAYRWRQLLRFDYTPQDCKQFHRAIEAVVIPAARRLYERRRRLLAVGALRPWDVHVDVRGRPPLKPFSTIAELEEKTSAIFEGVDPALGDYFEIMRREGLLDLDNRKGKAPGGYCTDFPASSRPFIFCNSVGVHDDVQTLLHEGGHAFHVFESSRLPYFQQMHVPLEFAEVASMGMEFLASPYLSAEQGGFYTPAETAQARVDLLEGYLLFWPYMAVVDAFQHWVYEEAEAASDPANCDAQWVELWERFMTGVDWSGLEQEKMTGWQRKLHIHEDPFYYVEYGLALLGAAQVWRNALKDQRVATAAYRRALALGGTATLPQLYAAAGARFAFDASTLGEVVDLMERTISELE